MSTVSTNYRELADNEVASVAADCEQAWMNPDIPQRQFDSVTRGELEDLRNGNPCAPFAAVIRCLRKLPLGFLVSRPKLLDVGASTGYYSEVIRLSGCKFDYHAVDVSPAFQALAAKLYPDIPFEVADARNLPFHDDSFGLVLSGAVLMHSADYVHVIAETARVSSRYVIFHRTPVMTEQPTRYYLKYGYGVPMLEVHFNEEELLKLFWSYGLSMIHSENVSFDERTNYGYRSYLCQKAEGLFHQAV